MAPSRLDVPTLADLLSRQDLSAQKLLSNLEDQESAALLLFTHETVEPANAPVLSLYYSAHLFALLLVDNIHEARFLTHRFPPTMAHTDQVLACARNLLRAVWQLQHQLVYQVLGQSTWPEELLPLVHRFREHFRTTTFQLLSRAYLSIPPSRAAKYLGLYEDPNTTESENTHPTPPAQQQTPNPESTADNTIDEAQDQDRNQEPKPLSKSEQQVVDEVTSRGWAWDAAQGLLYPRGGAPGSSTARSGREASSMGTGTDGGAGQDRGRGEVVQRMAILAALVVDLGESMIR